MKKHLLTLFAVLTLVTLSGCGRSSNSDAPAPDPATQPEAAAALFDRTCDRVKGLIAAKEFDRAREALAIFKQYKLTPEQQQVVDKLNAQIPAAK